MKSKQSIYVLTTWLTATLMTGWIHQNYLAAALATTIGLTIFFLLYQYYLDHDKPTRTELLTQFIDIQPPHRRDLWLISTVLILGLLTRLTAGTLHNLLANPTTATNSHSIVNTPELTLTYIIGLLLAAVIVGPIVEELVFRNGLQKLLTEHVSPWIAITVTSVVFAVLHVPSYGGFSAPIAALAVPMVVVFVDSSLFGWVYHRTGNISTAILCHAASNLISVAVTLHALVG